jgi:hypothetical protein
MSHPDKPWQSPYLQQLIDSLFTPDAQEARQPTGFPFKLPNGTIRFEEALSVEAIFATLFELGQMTEQEHACFQMLRIRFRHECELLLLHLMARQGIYCLPDDAPHRHPWLR